MATTATSLDLDHLTTYLNDHLGGSTLGVELAHRLASDNEGTELAAPLARIAREIEEDRDTLKGLMERLEISESALKVAGGWIGEKVHRFKPNRSAGEYGALDRMIDLETMMLGVSGKLALWHALQQVESLDPRLAEAGLASLADRAARQRDELESFRLQAAREAFAAS